MRSPLACVVLCVVATLLGCGGAGSVELATCKVVRNAGSAKELTDALAQSKSGECVVPTAKSYKGAFQVPGGVKVIAQKGATVTFNSEAESAPALTIAGGAGGGLFGLTVDGASAGGVWVRGGPAQVVNLKVLRADAIALAVSCPATDCLSEANAVTVDNADLENSEVGLAVFQSRVIVTGGISSGNHSTRLGYGYGVVATAGASLTVTGMTIEKNQLAGVVVDGAGGTSLALADAVVSNNLSYGVWAQGLVGTADLPKLVISGTKTAIESNHIVGVGAINSKGISITDARIAGTIKLKVSNGVGIFEDVGDGIGLFEGTGLARLTRVALQDNQRSQLLVDRGGMGIIIPETDRVAGGEFKLVIQNTTEKIDVPPAVLSVPGRTLLIQSDALDLGKPP